MSKVLFFSLVAVVIAALSHSNTNNSQDNIDDVICGSEIYEESCVADIVVAAAESSIDTNLIEKDSNNGPKTKERKERQETSVNAQNTPKQMRVIFKNRSKKPVKLWWKGFDGEKVLQAEFRNSPEETVINTFYGHEFFYTPFDNEDEVLYSVRMENHIDMIELLTKEEMAQRDQEFLEQKNSFMKEYFQETGRRWKNYYPRDPVTHFMYDITNIGQILNPQTEYIPYDYCPSVLNEIPEAQLILNNLEEHENEYKINEFNELNEKRIKNEEANKDDRNWFHHVPVYNAFVDYFKDSKHDLDLKIIRYNGTVLCQNLNVNEEDKIIPMQVLCTEPRVVSIGKFLSEAECEHIIQVGHYLGLRRSTVSESAIKTLDRTSSTVWLERKFSPIIDSIVKRIGNVLGIDENLLHLNTSSESLQFVHYLEGELYRPHVDYGTDLPNNRFITFLMYLNNVETGGNTSFPEASEECKGDSGYFGVRPKKGSAAWFYDLFPDGNVDSLTLHFAEPPTNGSQKFMTNLWIWDPFFK